MIGALLLLVGLGLGWFAAWREVCNLRLAVAYAQDKAERLLQVVLAKEAPRESGMYLDAAPDVPAVPGFWSEDGLAFIETDYEDDNV